MAARSARAQFHDVSASQNFRTRLVFYVNGKRIEDANPDPAHTLLEYLRDTLGLTGTKLGCGEGGCGACTVVVSRWLDDEKQIVHRTINACLMPVCAVDGAHVITTEGLGSKRTSLHPVQQRLALANGSQCGFCTPGFVMSMYGLLQNTRQPTCKQVEEAFGGNLCRCTGYRPILDGYKSFAVDAPDTPKALALHRVRPYAPGEQDLIFPPRLQLMQPEPLHFVGESVQWFRPVSLSGLLTLKHRYPSAKVVVGNTEIGIEVKFKAQRYPVLLSTSEIPEMSAISHDDQEVVIGASASLTSIEHYLTDLVERLPHARTSTARAVLHQLKLFAGNQIRNTACLGGNLATASPISDLNPLLSAAGATLDVASVAGGQRRVSVRTFFLAYRKVDLKPDEVIVRIRLPLCRDGEYVAAYKQSRRKEDDIAIVTAAFCVQLLQKQPGHWVVVQANLAYGGMAPRTVTCPKTEAMLLGKTWDADLLPQVYAALQDDLPLAPGAPGGMIQYRRSLTTSFFFKYFLQVCVEFGIVDKAATTLPRSSLAPHVPTDTAPPRGFKTRDLSALGDDLWRPVSRGEQAYNEAHLPPVGEPVVHQAAELQVTGEAQYTDDIPRTSNELYAALVTSSKAHAKILSIDTSVALDMPGVVGYADHTDVKGSNALGAVVHDEEIFATAEVTCYQQVIGVIVADTQRHAQDAARAVQIRYEEMPIVLSIDDAIKAGTLFKHDPPLQVVRGDVDAGFAKSDIVREGEVNVGGQEHFYLETNATLCVPGEHGEMLVHSSTQNPTKTSNFVASVLGVPANRVVTRCKRMGGGFGGKETRNVFISCAVAVAASKFNRPVRIMLDRDEDMAMTGTRHPFKARFKVGFNKDGRVQAVKINLWSNGGNSLDLSVPVMERALFHVDNSYNWPNVFAHGQVCKTNIPTNTAFRGFGGPQGLMMAENIIDLVARETGLSAHYVRERNMYKPGDATHFGQVLEDADNLLAVWKRTVDSAQLAERQAAVDKFNEAHRWRKRGIAVTPVKFGMSFTAKFMNQAGALVHVYQDGTALVSHGGTEMGQGLHTKMIQVAAQALGIPISSVYIADTQTDKVANTSPTAASVSSDLNGRAVLAACQQIMQRLEPLRKANPDMAFGPLCKQAHLNRIDLTGHGFYATPDIGWDWSSNSGRPFNYFSYGAAASEVEIDCLTGDHQVLRTDIHMDLGLSLNPSLDIGQVEGAFVQGCGLFMLEEQVWFPNGFLFTRGPGAYKIPSVMDIPVDLRVSLLKDAPNNRPTIHSSKGIGEPPLFLAASVFFATKEAIYAARKDAGLSGHFFLRSPATAEQIRLGCEDAFTKQFAA